MFKSKTADTCILEPKTNSITPLKPSKLDRSKRIFPRAAQPLASEYPCGNGRTLRLVKRTDKTALYSLAKGKVICGYEVFRIRIRPEKRAFGKIYPTSETYPSNADFGKHAKSCATLEKALERFEEFETLVVISNIT